MTTMHRIESQTVWLVTYNGDEIVTSPLPGVAAVFLAIRIGADWQITENSRWHVDEPIPDTDGMLFEANFRSKITGDVERYIRIYSRRSEMLPVELIALEEFNDDEETETKN